MGMSALASFQSVRKSWQAAAVLLGESFLLCDWHASIRQEIRLLLSLGYFGVQLLKKGSIPTRINVIVARGFIFNSYVLFQIAARATASLIDSL